MSNDTMIGTDIEECVGCKNKYYLTPICQTDKYRDVWWCSYCGALCKIDYNYDTPVTEWLLPKSK